MTAGERAVLPGSSPRESVHIPKQSGRAVRLRRGEVLRVIDPEGEQVADLVAFADPDRSEVFSAAQTREVARTLFVSTGHVLYAKSGVPLFTIVADDVGRHDLLFPPCRPEMYRRVYGQEDHPNCLENLAGALAPFGVALDEVPMPFNIFQHTVVHPDGRMEVRAPLSKPGDAILLRAERDLLVAVSSCSVDRSACNGYNPTPIDLEIYAADDV
jgi:uncharacterized protein YcgI (DUF1989 family)